MNGKREIKCPHCNQWTLWRENIHDRCLYCGEFLQRKAFPEKVEHDISSQVRTERDVLYIRPTDGHLKRSAKYVLKKMRNIVIYTQVAFIAFISFILWLISLLAL